MSNWISQTRIEERRLARLLGPDHLTQFAKRISVKEIQRNGPVNRGRAYICKKCQTAVQDCNQPEIHRLALGKRPAHWLAFQIGSRVSNVTGKTGTIKYIGKYDPQEETYPCIIQYDLTGTTNGIRNIATLRILE